ncbi:hypothetical protein Glove_73g8 [Diversispora epigaea]|uniref:Uncharacterized protein n=1 Tax=Diversispora epigaea TaxID=1348612 RepID=A0A397JGD2_9GLOM|nr:hypothetical protein Glove_73g8 [Diversispora epigaea]
MSEVSITSTPSISLSHISNSEGKISEKVESLPETKVSIPPTFKPNNPVHTHANFRNKTLEQYPDLYWEGSDENDDYYGIIDESLCPLCKLDHDDDDGIEGRYEIGSYYIKCEQRGIEIEVTA